jgi:hypothetical protein
MTLFRIVFVLCLLAGAVGTCTRVVGDRCLSRDAPEWLGAREEVRDTVRIPDGGAYEFFVLGDVQQGLGAYRKALRTVSADPEARFAVMCGDLVSSGGGARYPVLFDAAAREGSVVPVLTVPGNHDLAEDYSRHLGPLEWHVRAGPDLLIGLDDSLRMPDDAALDALEKLLAGSDARNRFVFLHRPLIREADPKPRRARLLSILRAGGVRWIFAGHRHSFEVREEDGLVECVNGCGGDMSGPFPVAAYLARVRVADRSVAVEMVNLGETAEVDALLTSTFVVHLYAPWRESGLWTIAGGVLIILTLVAGGVGYGPKALLPGLVATVPVLWPVAGIALAAILVCWLGARLAADRSR